MAFGSDCPNLLLVNEYFVRSEVTVVEPCRQHTEGEIVVLTFADLSAKEGVCDNIVTDYDGVGCVGCLLADGKGRILTISQYGRECKQIE